MRVTTTSVVIVALMIGSITFAGEIREFDVETIERFSNELMRVSQTHDNDSLSAEARKFFNENGR